jgi:hypothetical protein
MNALWTKRLTVMSDWMTRVAALSAAALVVTIASHIDWRADWRADWRRDFDVVFPFADYVLRTQ